MFSVKTASFYVLLALFIAAVSGGIALVVVRSKSASPGIEILLPTATPVPDLKVYVSGAVAEPGVYTMKDGDRLMDAIAAAGGATQDAQLFCVNLAAKMKDEAHFHVPSSEEPCQAAASAGPLEEANDKIDLNTAAIEQLKTLPGIGEVKAQAIIDYREREGGFQSTEQIMEVKGIGLSTYESIRDLVHAGGLPP